MTEDILKYPAGKFKAPVSYTTNDLHQWVEAIKAFPGKLRQSIIGLTEQQLDTNYRPGGWTLRQVVHHVADSHMNCLIRFKWALTEDNPTIKAYEEADWALLTDYHMSVEPSLKLIEGLHQRWGALMDSFTENEWAKTFVHPQSGETIPLKKAAALYAWHSEHHLAHITETVKKF